MDEASAQSAAEQAAKARAAAAKLRQLLRGTQTVDDLLRTHRTRTDDHGRAPARAAG